MRAAQVFLQIRHAVEIRVGVGVGQVGGIQPEQRLPRTRHAVAVAGVAVVDVDLLVRRPMRRYRD